MRPKRMRSATKLRSGAMLFTWARRAKGIDLLVLRYRPAPHAGAAYAMEPITTGDEVACDLVRWPDPNGWTSCRVLRAKNR
jgi:hypothetical protein